MKGLSCQTFNAIQQLIDQNKRLTKRPTVLFLEGGHYDPRLGADAFAVHSLRAAVMLAEHAIKTYGRRIRVVLGVLINDLAMACDESHCNIPLSIAPVSSSGPLPQLLEDVFAASPFVKRHRVQIYSERNAKNRGIKKLKRLLGSSATMPPPCLRAIHKQADEVSIYFESIDGQDIRLAKQSSSLWSALCPLVMSQHYTDVIHNLEQRFADSYPILLVDFSQVADRNKVMRGAELALRLFVPQASEPRAILNVFYADDDGEHGFIEECAQGDFADCM